MSSPAVHKFMWSHCKISYNLGQTVDTLHLVHTFISFLSLWPLPLPSRQSWNDLNRSQRTFHHHYATLLGRRGAGGQGGFLSKKEKNMVNLSLSQQVLSKVVGLLGMWVEGGNGCETLFMNVKYCIVPSSLKLCAALVTSLLPPCSCAVNLLVK